MPPNEGPPMTKNVTNNNHTKTNDNHATAAIPENQIRVEDKLYSTEKLADLHPGGPLFIKVLLWL